MTRKERARSVVTAPSPLTACGFVKKDLYKIHISFVLSSLMCRPRWSAPDAGCLDGWCDR